MKSHGPIGCKSARAKLETASPGIDFEFDGHVLNRTSEVCPHILRPAALLHKSRDRVHGDEGIVLVFSPHAPVTHPGQEDRAAHEPFVVGARGCASQHVVFHKVLNPSRSLCFQQELLKYAVCVCLAVGNQAGMSFRQLLQKCIVLGLHQMFLFGPHPPTELVVHLHIALAMRQRLKRHLRHRRPQDVWIDARVHRTRY